MTRTATTTERHVRRKANGEGSMRPRANGLWEAPALGVNLAGEDLLRGEAAA